MGVYVVPVEAQIIDRDAEFCLMSVRLRGHRGCQFAGWNDS